MMADRMIQISEHLTHNTSNKKQTLLSDDICLKISQLRVAQLAADLERIKSELAQPDRPDQSARWLAHNDSADSLLLLLEAVDDDQLNEASSSSIFSSFSSDIISPSSTDCDSSEPSLNLNHHHHHHHNQPTTHTYDCPTHHAHPLNGQAAGPPRRSRSLVDDAKLDTVRNRQLLDEIRSQVSGAAESRRSSRAQVDKPEVAQASPILEVEEEEDEASELERCLVDFPRHISDLDHCNHLLIKYEPELDPTHPGFHDLEYRARRKQLAEAAFNFRYGDKIPAMEYTDKERATWKVIYLRLKEAYKKYACEQHNSAIAQLELEGIYSSEFIPQLQEVSEFLKKRTGWQLRPVAGLLSARDFLSSLAFRVFQTTQYIRHWANPEHSVEPDCIHELMGHIPMLCDPEFAQFSQELGLASLGASDEQIERFATLYWFTVEFGLCKEPGEELKCYGAGLLSSYGEMEHALESGLPKLKEFVPDETALETYDDSEYQVVYYVANSFEEAKAKMKAYAAKHLQRQYELAYDPYSCTIKELNSYEQLETYANTIRSDLNRLTSAISKLRQATQASTTTSST